MARITKTEKTQIDKLWKSYLSKKRNLLKKGVSTGFIPEIARPSADMARSLVNSIKSQLASFTNRFNLNYQFQRLASGDYVPKTLVAELKRQQRRANATISKQYRRNLDKPYIPLSERGWAHPGAHRTVESDARKPKPRGYRKKAAEFKSQAEIERYITHLKDFNTKSLADWDEMWRENTIKAILDVYGDAAKDLINKIKALDLNTFVSLMETQDISISYVYTSTYENEGLEKLKSYFDQEDYLKAYRTRRQQLKDVGM